MKKIYLIITALLLVLASCDQDNIGDIYEPDGPYVAFSSSVVVDNFLTAENNYSVNVQVVRSDASSPLTVGINLEITDAIHGLFELESNTVTFNEGEHVAYVKIVPMVEPTSLSPGVTYDFYLSLTDGNVSELFGQTTYKASLKVDFSAIGTGSFVSEFFGDAWGVEIYKANMGAIELYKVIGLYEEGYDIIIIVNGTVVTINGQAAWYYDDEYGDVHIEGTGTIDGKTLTLSLTHFIPDVYAWDPANEVLTLP